MENRPPIRPWFRLASTVSLMEQPPVPQPRPALVQAVRPPTPTESLRPRPPPPAQEQARPTLVQALRPPTPTPTEPLRPPQEQPRPAIVQAPRPLTPTREALRPSPPPIKPPSPIPLLPKPTSTSIASEAEAVDHKPPPPIQQSPKLTPTSVASQITSLPSTPRKSPASETRNDFTSSILQKSSSSGTLTQPPQTTSARSPPPSRPTPPSPLKLPQPQLKSNSEPEQKTMFMKDNIQRKNGNEKERPSITKGGGMVRNRKPLDEEDMEMVRVITIAGENKGAQMELLSSNRKGMNKVNTNTSGDSDDSSDISKGGKLKGKIDNKVPLNTAYINSNVQGVNNSILFHASFAHNDPGVHFVLRKPSPAKRIHQQDPFNKIQRKI